MVELTPSQKGAAAEAAITAAVIQQGFTVLRPLCEGRRYDLVVDLEPALLRLQCKVARRVAGALSIALQTCRYTPGAGYVRSRYSAAEIDAIAAYAPDLGTSYLIPIGEVSAHRSMHLRVEPTGNNQADRIRWARNYELEAVLPRVRDASLRMALADS